MSPQISPEFVALVHKARYGSAMNLSAVYRCVTLLAGAIASCPIRISGEDGEYPSLRNVLTREANPLMSSYELAEWMVIRMVLDGNAFVRIERQGKGGGVSKLTPMTGVTVTTDPDSGLVTYVDSDGKGLDFTELLHYRSPVLDTKTMLGESLLETGGKNAVAIGHLAEQFAAKQFESGIFGQHLFKFNKKMTADQSKKLRKQMEEKLGKGNDSVGTVIIVPEGAEHSVLQLDAEKMQLIESRGFQVEDFARAIGVSSIFLNQESKSTSFGTGVQSIGRFLVQYSLMMHINRLVAELNRKLILNRTSPISLDTSWLTQGDLKDRFAAYAVACGGPFATVDQVRGMENWDALSATERDELLNRSNANATTGAGTTPPNTQPEDQK